METSGMAGYYDPDDQIRKNRRREPLFLGSKTDPITGDLVGGPTIPASEPKEERSKEGPNDSSRTDDGA